MKIAAVIIGGLLIIAVSSCAITRANSVETSSHELIGGWSAGTVKSGSGAYLEEDFLADGEYCIASFDTEIGYLYSGKGSWSRDGNTLQIEFVTRRKQKLIKTSETRVNFIVSKSTLKFNWLTVKDAAVHSRLIRAADRRWCEAAEELMADLPNP
jgi:hypothetical protein